MQLARVQSRGQITLPADIRRAAGIEPGTALYIEVVGKGEIRLSVLPKLTPDELRERYPIEEPIDWPRVREEWQDEAAREVIGRLSCPSD